jgi:hypothetical protein
VYERRSVAYVRVFDGPGESRVVLVVEPVDNPGTSAVNAAAELVAGLSRAFGRSNLRVFVAFADDPSGDGWMELTLQGDGSIAFAREAGDEVARLVPHATEIPARSEATLAQLGGERHPLLALAAEPEPERRPLTDLAVVAVADLPWAHHPFRCPSKARFAELGAVYPDSPAEISAVGAHWF